MNPFLADCFLGLRLSQRSGIVSLSIWALSVLVVAVVLASLFSARQPATVALDVGLSVIRLLLPVVTVVLIQELLTREFDRKLFLTSLTYPRPRHHFLLGRVAAVFVLLIAALMLMALVLAALVAWVGQSYPQSTPPSMGGAYLLTIGFVALDVMVVLSIGTLLAVLSTTPSFVLVGTLGFVLVARSYSPIISLLAYDDTLVGNAEAYSGSLNFLGVFVPDLAMLDVRMIALYDSYELLPDGWGLRVVGALAYVVALVALAVWALNRRKIA